MTTKSSFSEIAKICYLFSSNPRRDIVDFLQLNNSPQKVSTISKSTGMSIQSTKKHIEVLSRFEVVAESNEESVYGFYLTNTGRLLVSSAKFLSFVLQNREFFSSHTLGDLPEYLIRRMPCLKECTLVTKMPVIFLELEGMAKEFDRFFYAVISDLPFIMSDPLCEKVKNNKNGTFKISFLFGQNQTIPNESEFLDKVGLRTTISQNVVQRRMCKEVSANVFVTEKKGCVMFPFNESPYRTDTTRMFTGSTPEFIHWCKDFFDYKLRSSIPVARPRR